MLLPALSRAKGKAQRAVCLNHARQFGIAFELYAGDFRRSLPVTNWDGGRLLQGRQQLSSYVMNGAMSGFRGRVSFARYRFLPGDVVMWEPVAGNVVAYNDGANQAVEREGPGRRHGSGIHVLAIGGHAVFCVMIGPGS